MELREPSGNKRKRKKEKGKNERMREPSGRWRWEKGEDVDKIMYTCVVDKIQEKKKKEKEMYGGKKKGKELEITI